MHLNFIVLLVDCPVNSTQLDNTPVVSSHPNLEISSISMPGVLQEVHAEVALSGLESTNENETLPETEIIVDQGLKCHCGKECTRCEMLTKKV